MRVKKLITPAEKRKIRFRRSNRGTLAPNWVGALRLLESGSYVLLENGSKRLFE